MYRRIPAGGGVFNFGPFDEGEMVQAVHCITKPGTLANGGGWSMIVVACTSAPPATALTNTDRTVCRDLSPESGSAGIEAAHAVMVVLPIQWVAVGSERWLQIRVDDDAAENLAAGCLALEMGERGLDWVSREPVSE